MGIFWLIFWLYIVPVLVLIGIMIAENENPFSKKHARDIFTPFINLWGALIIVLIYGAVILIETGDFCEDVWKSFKKHFC